MDSAGVHSRHQENGHDKDYQRFHCKVDWIKTKQICAFMWRVITVKNYEQWTLSCKLSITKWNCRWWSDPAVTDLTVDRVYSLFRALRACEDYVRVLCQFYKWKVASSYLCWAIEKYCGMLHSSLTRKTLKGFFLWNLLLVFDLHVVICFDCFRCEGYHLLFISFLCIKMVSLQFKVEPSLFCSRDI